MAYGLQCFDSNGKCIYDSSINTSTYLGTFTITVSPSDETVSGSFVDNRLNSGKLWWYIASRQIIPIDWSIAMFGLNYSGIQVTISGQTISWKVGRMAYTTDQNNDVITVMYGTYV